MKNSIEEKLLGVTFDNDFSCVAHVNNMCQKTSKTLHTLHTLHALHHCRIIMKAFIESQFGYCPLVWIFHGYSRILNNTMHNTQERALRLVYTDYHSTYEQLLARDSSYRIHHRNLAGGGWRVASGGWRVAGGEWRMAGGGWRYIFILIR